MELDKTFNSAKISKLPSICIGTSKQFKAIAERTAEIELIRVHNPIIHIFLYCK